MNKIQATNLLVAIIGLLSLIFGFVSVYKGSSFDTYIFSFVQGVVLLGAAYFNNEKWKEENKK